MKTNAGELWSEEDFLARLLQLLPEEAAKASVTARHAEVAQLFRDAYSDGLANGMLAAQVAGPIL